MSKPFFTIAVVSLNAEKLIKMTIDSALEQTIDDYEIIVKDGLSKDGTVSQIPSDPKIKLYEESDKSIYDAMNQAIGHSSGKYVIFMNCGDVFASNDVLEKIKEGIGDGQYGMVYGDYTRDGIVHKQPSVLSRFYMYRTPLCHQTIFFDGEYLRDGNVYNTDYKILGDYDLELRIMVNKPTKYINCTVCAYLGGGVSESEKGIRQKKSERERILKNNYTKKERVKFYVHRKLTFPKLRSKLVRSKNPMIKKLYQKTVNSLNR
ncbi:MAG: glycosyltransferase [Ruminococcaceae bacterium]|nr:glycosyltransferase [Oscillospiraceae bacterium]